MDSKKVVESAAKVYLTVDEKGLVHPEKLFDPIYDKSNLAFWAKNIKTWSDFLYQYSDYIKPRHINQIPAAAELLKNNTPPTNPN
jgi:hypothetical protein